MTVDVDELELQNLRQSAEGEFAIARIIGGIPVDAAAALVEGVSKRMARVGFEAYFKQETGFGVIWARRKRTGASS